MKMKIKKKLTKNKKPIHGFPPPRNGSLSCVTLESAAGQKGVLRLFLKDTPSDF